MKALWRRSSLARGNLRERENVLDVEKRKRRNKAVVGGGYTDWACWSVSAKISECINMPRRQVEYNPSYIQSSRPTLLSTNHPLLGLGNDAFLAAGRGWACQDSHLIILKMFHSPETFSLFLKIKNSCKIKNFVPKVYYKYYSDIRVY